MYLKIKNTFPYLVIFFTRCTYLCFFIKIEYFDSNINLHIMKIISKFIKIYNHNIWFWIVKILNQQIIKSFKSCSLSQLIKKYYYNMDLLLPIQENNPFLLN